MNIASRITALAKPDHIMIGSITYQRLGSRLEQTPKEFGLKNVESIHYETGDAYTIILVASNKKISEDEFAS